MYETATTMDRATTINLTFSEIIYQLDPFLRIVTMMASALSTLAIEPSVGGIRCQKLSLDEMEPVL